MRLLVIGASCTVLLLLSSAFPGILSGPYLRRLTNPDKSIIFKSHPTPGCDVKNEDVPYLSKHRQDQIVYERLFLGTTDCKMTSTGSSTRIVVEMSGRDGKTYSNSWFFQYALGWTSILIEALPSNYDLLIKNRPDAINIHGTICILDNEEESMEVAVTTTGDNKDSTITSPSISTTSTTNTTVTVPCLHMTKLFKEHQITHVDVFFLDVGKDGYGHANPMVVLETIDWKRITIDVLIILHMTPIMIDDKTTMTTATDDGEMRMNPSAIMNDNAIRALLYAQGYISPFSMLDECQRVQSNHFCRSSTGSISEIFILKQVWIERQGSNNDVTNEHADSDAG